MSKRSAWKLPFTVVCVVIIMLCFESRQQPRKIHLSGMNSIAFSIGLNANKMHSGIHTKSNKRYISFLPMFDVRYWFEYTWKLSALLLFFHSHCYYFFLIGSISRWMKNETILVCLLDQVILCAFAGISSILICWHIRPNHFLLE